MVLFDFNQFKDKNKESYQNEKIVKTVPEDIDSLLKENQEFPFYELKICDFANIRIAKTIIDDIKTFLNKNKFNDDSIFKLYFDGGCSGMQTIVRFIDFKLIYSFIKIKTNFIILRNLFFNNKIISREFVE